MNTWTNVSVIRTTSNVRKPSSQNDSVQLCACDEPRVDLMHVPRCSSTGRTGRSAGAWKECIGSHPQAMGAKWPKWGLVINKGTDWLHEGRAKGKYIYICHIQDIKMNVGRIHTGEILLNNKDVKSLYLRRAWHPPTHTPHRHPPPRHLHTGQRHNVM